MLYMKSQKTVSETTLKVPSFAAKETSRQVSLPDDLGFSSELDTHPRKRHARWMQLPHPSWGAVLSPCAEDPPGTHPPQKKRRQIVSCSGMKVLVEFGLGSLNDWPWNRPGPSPPPRVSGLLLLLLTQVRRKKILQLFLERFSLCRSFHFVIFGKPTHVLTSLFLFLKETFFLSQLKCLAQRLTPYLFQELP